MAELIKNRESLAEVRAKLNAAITAFSSRAAFEAANIPTGVDLLYVIDTPSGGGGGGGPAQPSVFQLMRSELGDWVAGDGSVWRLSFGSDALQDVLDAAQAAEQAAQDALTQAGVAAGAALAAQASEQAAQDAENSLLEWAGAWATATSYQPSDIVFEGTSGSAYVCVVAHTSGTFSTDLAANRWAMFAQRGSTGFGAGDMNNSDNLAGLTDKPAALVNLGINLSLNATGMVMPFAGSTAPTGWLAASGQTIGSASSGAAYANADAQALFTHMWGQFDNTLLPILDSAGAASTRGANAAADWAADKRLPILDLRGEFVRGLDGGRGVDAGRALGSAQGDANKSHSHSVTDPGHIHAAPKFFSGNNTRTATQSTSGPLISGGDTASSTTGISIAASGGAEARPRNVALLYCIKL